MEEIAQTNWEGLNANAPWDTLVNNAKLVSTVDLPVNCDISKQNSSSTI